MNNILTVLTVATAAATLPMAHADNWYADGGYNLSSADYETGAESVDFDIGAIVGHVGYDFTTYFGVEGEVAIGVQDETFTISATDITLGLNYLVGAYGKVQLPVTDRISLFARAGVVNVELEAKFQGFGSGSQSSSDTGAGFGGGAMIDVTDTLFVRGDYTRFDIERYEAHAFTVAVGVKF